MPKADNINDFFNKKYGRLTVKSFRMNGYNKLCKCVCDCGNIHEASWRKVKNGHTKSCGCLSIEMSTKNILKNKTHGMKNSKTYSTWRAMRKRCAEKRRFYKNISVCERWNKFENFLKDMGERPFPKATIDRIDGTKGYEPGNCRWATMKEQQRNRKDNVLIEINGQKKCISEWAEILKIPVSKIKNMGKRV